MKERQNGLSTGFYIGGGDDSRSVILEERDAFSRSVPSGFH